MAYGSFNDEANSVWDFTRCQKPSGKIYGSPNRCRPPAVEIGAKEEQPKAQKTRGMRIGKTVKNMSVGELEKLLKDPRIKPHQIVKLKQLIAEKKGVKTESKPAAKLGPKKEEKKSGDPKKDADRKEYENLLAKAKEANDASSAIKKELEARSGKPVTAGTSLWPEYVKRLKAEGLTVNKIADINNAARDFRKAKGREWLDNELVAKRVAQNTADWKAIPKEEKKAAIRKEIESLVNKKRDIARLNQDIKTWSDMVKGVPELNTPANRTGLIAMRALRAKMMADTKGERQARAAEVQKFVDSAPKYKEVPGSAKPIKKMSSEQLAAEMRKIENEHVARAQKFDKEGKSFEAGQERQNALMANKAADRYDRGSTLAPPLEVLYRMQGYDAKPEAVATRSDLDKRKDLVTGEDGKALVLWRGVTGAEFADQFKGMGDMGDTHYAGRGIYGNGSYAASPAPGAVRPKGAFEEAKSYAGWGDEGLDRRMTAFGIRKDANIVEFSGANWRERNEEFGAWKDETVKRAEKETGRTYNDVGEAAAALGVHAYRVPQGRDEDFWVILNRGALVVAGDPQIEDFNK